MNTNKVVACIGFAVVTWCALGEEMIEYLRAAVRDDGPHFTGKCEDVRELKYPGQRFVHDIAMTIEGTGTAVTPRCWGWFKTRETLYLRHVSHVMMIESIESTPEDLEKGVIKSRYSIQRLDEQLESATKKLSVGELDTAAFGRCVKTLCEKSDLERIEESEWLNFVQKVDVFKRLVSWVDGKIASDGTFVADEVFVSKNLPGYSAVVGLMHDFDGTTLVSKWEFGKGYTSVDFSKTNLKQNDKEMIAKLIYRTNPLSVNDVLPADKKSGDRWIIDSRVIGGAVFDLGIDFDRVDGAIQCRHMGVELLDEDDAADEFRLLSKRQMQAKTLDVPRDDRSKLELVSTNNEKLGDVAVSFSPCGKIQIFDEHDKEGRHIYYLREVKMDGTVNSQISRRTNLLKDVEFTGTDLKVNLVYTQSRAK